MVRPRVSDVRFIGHECKACGHRDRYVKTGRCCNCVAMATKKSQKSPAVRGAHHNIKAAPKKKAGRLPIARSEFIKPLTREQLMAGR